MAAIKVIKIVERRENGALISFNNPDSEQSLAGTVVHYSPDVISVPNTSCGDLCAFESLGAATRFLQDVRPQRPGEIWSAVGDEGTHGRAFDMAGCELLQPPEGTVFMSSLRLTKKLSEVGPKFASL